MPDFPIEAARLHARLPAHRRAVGRARDRIREALETVPGTWAVCCSGGKDSAALLDVAVEAGWRGPVFTFRYRETPEENVELVKALADRHGLGTDTLNVTGAFDAFDRVGHFFATPSTDEERAAVRWMNNAYKREVGVHQEARGWAGIMMGLRKDESRVRRMTLSKKGALYRTETRSCWTCCPLLDWSGRDVWARIASADLPYLDRYDEAEDRVLERSEETWLAVDCWRWGMAAEMKRRDPTRWHALVAEYPDLAREL